MKSTVKTLLCLLLAAGMILSLAACGAEKNDASGDEETAADGSQDADAAEFQTMGDVFASESVNEGYSEEYFVYAFEANGVAYRAIAEMPADVSEAVWALDFFDEDRDAKIQEMVAPLPIMRLDNLTEMIPSQEELDALVGRNVQELLDEGWTFSYWDMGAMEGGMYHGPFSFQFTFDGTLENPEDVDESQADRLTVKSVTYDGIGDATSVLDELASGN